MRYQIHKYIDVNKVIVMFMVVKNFKRFDLFMFVFCCIIFNVLLIVGRYEVVERYWKMYSVLVVHVLCRNIIT